MDRPAPAENSREPAQDAITTEEDLFLDYDRSAIRARLDAWLEDRPVGRELPAFQRRARFGSSQPMMSIGILPGCDYGDGETLLPRK